RRPRRQGSQSSGNGTRVAPIQGRSGEAHQGGERGLEEEPELVVSWHEKACCPTTFLSGRKPPYLPGPLADGFHSAMLPLSFSRPPASTLKSRGVSGPQLPRSQSGRSSPAPTTGAFVQPFTTSTRARSD